RRVTDLNFTTGPCLQAIRLLPLPSRTSLLRNRKGKLPNSKMICRLTAVIKNWMPASSLVVAVLLFHDLHAASVVRSSGDTAIVVYLKLAIKHLSRWVWATRM